MRKTLVLLFALFCFVAQAETIPVPGTEYEARVRVYENPSKDQRGTVLILNGCDGPGQMHYYSWAKYLQEYGFNAIIVDSFTTRNLRNICPVKGNGKYSHDSAPDAVAVAKWAKTQKWSNGNVAVVGFSLGGITSLALATTAYGEIDSAVAFYPTCQERFQQRELTIPLQVHIGTEDQWTDANRCRALQESSNFKDAEFNYYTNAHHLFDEYGSGSAVCFKGVPCWYGYNEEANTLSRQRVKEFLDLTIGKLKL